MTAPHIPAAPPGQTLGASLGGLFRAAVGYAATRASGRVGKVVRRLEGVAEDVAEEVEEIADGVTEPQGVVGTAVAQGVEAAVSGGNPVLAGLKGAWQGMDLKLKVAVVLGLVLLLLLAPVALVLLLLALLVAGVVAAVRSATR